MTASPIKLALKTYGSCEMPILRVAMPQIPPGRAVVVEANGTRLALCRTASGLHAMPEFCPHQELTLDGGRVRGESIICPHHGARFSLADGKSLSPLTPKPLQLLACRVVGDDVEIEV
jgi:3-phenylpropionate/trans-cinnamate dioxygenase ferredoxin subunit